MLQSNYTARSGLIAQQERMDVIANNIANVNTVGFKSVRADFKDMLYQTLVRPEQPQDGLNLQRGHGVLLGATTRDFSQGSAQYTNNPMDVMIVGDAFFAVQNTDGETTYTRDGAFAVSEEGGESFLVTGDGHYLLDEGGQRISVGDADESQIEINPDGRVFTVHVTAGTPPVTTRTPRGKLGLYSFMNRMGLEAVSGNRFAVTENSGEAQLLVEVPEGGQDVSVQAGMLEASNVDLATEMTRMIRAQRTFSLASRALITADEMDGKANQLRS